MFPGVLKLENRPKASVETPTSRSRRSFLFTASLATAATLLRRSPLFSALKASTQETTPDLAHDTLDGFLAFIVPGSDPYSINQGKRTADPGALDAGISNILIRSLDESSPYLPQFLFIVAGLLNQLALAVNSSPSGPFGSPYTNLKFAEKGYSSANHGRNRRIPNSRRSAAGTRSLPHLLRSGSFRSDHALVNRAADGWTISHYEGFADGRDELLGYFEHRRKAKDDSH